MAGVRETLGRTIADALGTLTSPLRPGDYLGLVNPLWSARETRGRIVSIRQETDDAVTLVIQPGWGWPAHRAGQFVGLGLQVDGRWRWRSYSLTSPAGASETITVTVKEEPDGLLSPRLVRQLEPGTVVRLAEPQGDFTLPPVMPDKLLFLVAGSGVTPVMGMLRTLDQFDAMPATTLLYAAPRAGDMLFADELASLEQRNDALTVVRRYTSEDGRFGFPADLDASCPDWRERETFACGPGEFLDAIAEAFEAADVEERLHMERFTLNTDVGAAGGTVTFLKSGTTVEVDGSTTLLEAGERAGLTLPYGCRMGICHTCVVPLAKGHVRDVRTGDDHDDGSVQTCVSVASGDCALDI